jgi:glucose/arabinose dehydrogenase
MLEVENRVTLQKSNRPSSLTAWGLFLTACFCVSLAATPAASATFPTNVTLRNYFKVGTDSLTFQRPVLVKPYPGEDSAFIVLQQNGRIITVRWNGSAWRRTDTATITVQNGTGGIDEQGLLGFAFHPNFLQNRKYYVYYVSGTASVRYDRIAERIASSSLRPATSDTQRSVWRISDPYDNHNAGTLGFDNEGFLILGIGDGGTTQGDPQNRAQSTDSVLGKFHRIDVNGTDDYPTDSTRNYAIPATNPFVGMAGYRPEIWAYGVRNPWKWSLHPTTGEIWVGEVGQDKWEKVSRVPKGANLGWRLREGPICYNPSTGCPSAGILPPAVSLQRSHASSITGGVFFQGTPGSAFDGAYIFGDYGTHRIWAMRARNDSLVDSTVIGKLSKVVSFDRDRQGRVLATSISPDEGFGITSNVGRVLVLESPDMVPVAVNRAARRNVARSFRLQDVLAHPERYHVRGLDGREIQGAPSGTFLVIEKANPAHRRLMVLP